MPWTSEQIELLKTHFDAGLSCAQIARRIGMTRNAVIGKLNRLGLSRPKSAIAKQPERKVSDLFRRQRPLVHKVVGATALRAEPWVEVGETLVANPQRCSLLDLTDVKCRWPIGDPGSASFGFCGRDQVRGLSYCATHARMAYG